MFLSRNPKPKEVFRTASHEQEDRDYDLQEHIVELTEAWLGRGSGRWLTAGERTSHDGVAAAAEEASRRRRRRSSLAPRETRKWIKNTHAQICLLSLSLIFFVFLVGVGFGESLLFVFFLGFFFIYVFIFFYFLGLPILRLVRGM